MTEPSTCPHCGVRLPPVSDAFCPECGERLDALAEPSAAVEEPATAVSPQEVAARRQTRMMLGTMFGFLAGAVFSFGCCGQLALFMFFGFYVPQEGSEVLRLAAGIGCVALTTWAGRTLAKRMRDAPSQPPAPD